MACPEVLKLNYCKSIIYLLYFGAGGAKNQLTCPDFAREILGKRLINKFICVE